MKRMAAAKAKEDSMTDEQVHRSERKLQVSALRSGTVLDHLSAGSALRTLQLLKLDADATVLVGVNLQSKRLGRKDLIKVANRELTPEEINTVALLSPHASLSIIREFEVVTKMEVRIPAVIEGLIRCVNPACITKGQRDLSRILTLQTDPLKLRCYYCERSFPGTELEFI